MWLAPRLHNMELLRIEFEFIDNYFSASHSLVNASGLRDVDRSLLGSWIHCKRLVTSGFINTCTLVIYRGHLWMWVMEMHIIYRIWCYSWEGCIFLDTQRAQYVSQTHVNTMVHVQWLLLILMNSSLVTVKASPTAMHLMLNIGRNLECHFFLWNFSRSNSQNVSMVYYGKPPG